MPSLLDVRHSLRGLLHSPGFTLVAVLTLSVGIGATAMVCSFVSAVFAAADPPRDIDRSVGLWSCPIGESDQKGVVSPRDYEEWRARARSFDRVGAFRRSAYNLGGIDQPVRVSGIAIGGDYLEIVGDRLIAGRRLRPGDEQPGAERVALVGERFSSRHFGAPAAALGRVIPLDGEPRTIVGVLAARPLSPDLAVPLRMDPRAADYGVRSLIVFARRADAVTLEAARREMLQLATQLQAERPAHEGGWTVNTRPLSEEFIGRNARIVFSILVAAVAAVLLIGCANIASLMVARGLDRRRDLAIRSALGATRSRLFSHQLLESGWIALAGGLAGVALAHAGLATLRAAAPSMSEVVADVSVGWRVLLFAASASAVAAFAAGVVPALHGARLDLDRVLREGSTGSVGGGARRLRVLLVGGEVALSVALLVTAGLLLHTLVALQSIEPGFDARGVLTARVTLPETQYRSREAVSGFYERVVALLVEQPGVVSASVGARVPAAGSRYNPNRSLVVEERSRSAGDAAFVAFDLTVAPQYFSVLRIPLVEGRDFDPRDRAGAPLVVIVNRTMAARYWGGRSAIGARLRLGDEETPDAWRTIVGVVGDIRNDDIDAPPVPHVYVPSAQRPQRTMTFVVRTRGDPAALAGGLRAGVAAVAPDLPLYEIATLEQIVRQDLADTRVLVWVFVLYACAALLLSTVGIGGLLAQSVSQRVPEIGIRLALGAPTRRVASLVLGQAAASVGAGMLAGLVLAAAVGRVIAGLLYRVSPLDPATYVVVVAALGTSAAVAAVAPLRRASRVDPIVAVRGYAARG